MHSCQHYHFRSFVCFKTGDTDGLSGGGRDSSDALASLMYATHRVLVAVCFTMVSIMIVTCFHHLVTSSGVISWHHEVHSHGTDRYAARVDPDYAGTATQRRYDKPADE